MVASQNVESQQQNADMYCTHYGEYYPDNSQYYMHGPTPELCHAHVCAVQGEFGPVTVPMVSTNSSPPMAMPVQVPPGHVVQQIVDESGTLRHVILSTQHPAGLVHLPSHNTQHYGAGNGTSQQFYQSLATGYPPPPHYHSSIPPGHPGAAGPTTTHLGHSPPPPPQQPPTTSTSTGTTPPTTTNQSATTYYKDERTQKQYIKLKKKIHDKKLDNMKKELVNGFKRTTPAALNKENNNNNNNSSSKEMNSVGTSEDGEESSIADEEDSVQIIADILSSVQAPKVSELSSRSALLQWAPPTRLSETGNNNNNNDNTSSSVNDIDLSDLRYEVLLSDKSKEMKFKSIYSGCSLSCRIQDLKPGQEYSVCLQVHYEEMQGTATDPVKFLTPPCEPDPPLPPKLQQRQKNSLHLRWNHCNDNGSIIKFYLLECDDGKNGDFIELYRGKVKQHIVNKLQPSTSYRFRLAAINDIGKSKYSDIVIYNTLNNPPLKPQPPNLLETTINSLLLKWNYRINDEEFTLQMADSKTDYYMAVYNGKDTEYLCKDLDCFTNYKFRLRVENDGGISPWSDEVEYKTLPDRPGRPSKPIVKGRIHAYSFKLKWEPPQYLGGAQIQEYLLEINSGSGYEKIYNGIDTEAICDKLTPGTTYQLRVSCVSTGGISNYSDPCTVTTEAINPGQCSIPKLFGKPKSNSITIKWLEPDYNGGAPILEYEVEMLTCINSSRQIIHKNKQQECTINDNNMIKPGHDYMFTVRAVNRIGPSIWSEPLKVTSGPAPPEQPQSPHIQCKTPFHLFIEWQQPNCNGATIQEYRLEMSTFNDNEENFQCIYQGSELFYDVKGLTPFTTYYFRVQASNAAGSSPFSLPSVTITPAAPPSQITTIRSESSPTTIKLYWHEPMNNGSPILYYHIEIGDKLIRTENSSNEYLLTNLQPDTLYKIKIQPINIIGCGSYSSIIKILTLRLPPTPPKLECISYGHNYLKLKWGDGKNIDYTQYQLELENIRTHEFQCIYKGTSFIYKLNKLNELTMYKFRINAINDAGVGDYSDIYEFKTCIAPPNQIKSPKIIDIEHRSCIIEWLPSRNTFQDSIIYQVQLGKTKEHNNFKQVYRGSDTRCAVDNLEAGTEYSVRLCPIRLNAINGELQGAYTPITNFTTIPETTTTTLTTTTTTLTKTTNSSIQHQQQQQHHHHHHHHHKNRNLLSLLQHTIRSRTLSDQPVFYAFLVVIAGICIALIIISFI